MKMNGPAIRWLVVLTVHLCWHILPLRGVPLFKCCGGGFARVPSLGGYVRVEDMRLAGMEDGVVTPTSLYSGKSSAEMSGTLDAAGSPYRIAKAEDPIQPAPKDPEAAHPSTTPTTPTPDNIIKWSNIRPQTSQQIHQNVRKFLADANAQHIDPITSKTVPPSNRFATYTPPSFSPDP